METKPDPTNNHCYPSPSTHQEFPLSSRAQGIPSAFEWLPVPGGPMSHNSVCPEGWEEWVLIGNHFVLLILRLAVLIASASHPPEDPCLMLGSHALLLGFPTAGGPLPRKHLCSVPGSLSGLGRPFPHGNLIFLERVFRPLSALAEFSVHRQCSLLRRWHSNAARETEENFTL